MLQLEALIAFIVFLFFLGAFIDLQLSELNYARSARDLFNAELDAKSYALIIESFYNNSFQGQAKNLSFPCWKESEAGGVVCGENKKKASGKLLDNSIINELRQVNLSEHYR